MSRVVSWSERYPGRVGTISGWFQQSASIFSALLVLPVLMRVLSKDDVGRWFAFQSFLNMANLVDFGVGFAVSRQVAHCIGGGKKQSGTDFLDFGSGWDGVALIRVTAEKIKRCTVCLAAIVGTIIFELVLPHTRLIPPGEGDSFRLTWYMMMGSSLLITATAIENTILNGLGKVYLTRTMTGAFFFLNGLLVMLAAMEWGKLWAMAIASLISALIYRITAAFALRKAAPEIFLPERRKVWRSGFIYPLLRVAAPVGFVNVGSFLVSSIQTPLIGSLLGPVAVAPYYLAQKIGQFLNQAARQFLMPQIPFFTRAFGADDKPAARRLMLKTIGLNLAATLAVNSVFLFFSPWFALFLTGKSIYVDQTTLAVMALDYSILGIAVSWGYFVLASGRNPFVWSTLLSGLLNVGLLFILIPKLGILGIPIASLASGILISYWFNLYQGWKLYNNLNSK